MANVPNLPGDERQRIARQALDELSGRRDHSVVLRVRCGRGHHVAEVLRTPSGPVFESRTGLRAHGSRDRSDTGHNASRRGTAYADLLAGDEFTDDLLPANCECGAHELSRTDLSRAIAGNVRTFQLP